MYNVELLLLRVFYIARIDTSTQLNLTLEIMHVSCSHATTIEQLLFPYLLFSINSLRPIKHIYHLHANCRYDYRTIVLLYILRRYSNIFLNATRIYNIYRFFFITCLTLTVTWINCYWYRLTLQRAWLTSFPTAQDIDTDLNLVVWLTLFNR